MIRILMVSNTNALSLCYITYHRIPYLMCKMYINASFTFMTLDIDYCRWQTSVPLMSWWRHQMETFSALLAICAGNSPVTGEVLAQRPVTRSFDVFFDLRLNEWLSKQWEGWWFETPSRPLRRHRRLSDCHILLSSLVMSFNQGSKSLSILKGSV